MHVTTKTSVGMDNGRSPNHAPEETRRRYLPVNGTPVQGEKFKRVMKGKAVRYVPVPEEVIS